LSSFFEYRVADLILPATIWLEELGLKDTASHIYLMERALQPQNEARPLLRILRDLAERLGIDDFFPWQDEETYLDTLLAPQCTDEGRSLTLEQLRLQGGLWQKSRLSHVAYPDKRFHTPSGKVEFWSERAKSWIIPTANLYSTSKGLRSTLPAPFPPGTDDYGFSCLL
jgi:anaerobic selenocysteine-containing dehydrogenase